MDYKAALQKLESLRLVIEKQREHPATDIHTEIAELYGECEEIVHRFLGVSPVTMPAPRGGVQPITYPNLIEAGYLSEWSIHQQAGYFQLLKLIGKVRQVANDPNPPPASPSLTGLIQTLSRFRECCQYIEQPPANERAVQDIIWIMLRSQHDRVDRESMLQKFGNKGYKPDFGIPDLQTLIEVKYIGPKTDPASIQEELLASAERHGIDPQRYLTSVLAKIAATPISELGQFLPEVWKREDAAEPKAGIIKDNA